MESKGWLGGGIYRLVGEIHDMERRAFFCLPMNFFSTCMWF